MGTASSLLQNTQNPIQFKKGPILLIPPDNRLSKIGIYFVHIVNTAKMIELVDEWEDLLNRYKHSANAIESLLDDVQKGPKLRKLIQKGTPSKFRWETWKALLKAGKKVDLEKYINLPIAGDPHISVIRKDVDRAFPQHPYFDRSKHGYYGQTALYRILGKFAEDKKDIGYCQGMNYVAGFLLMVSGGLEQEVYYFLEALCKNFHYWGFVCEEMPLIKQYLWVFDKLFKVKNSKLYEHFKQQDVLNDMWVFKWFLTFYTAVLPKETAVLLWDWLLVDGLRVLFKVAFAILDMLEEKLLSMDGSEILIMLNNIGDYIPSCKEFIKIAKKTAVNKSKYYDLIEAYKQEKKLKKHPTTIVIVEDSGHPENEVPNVSRAEVKEANRPTALEIKDNTPKEPDLLVSPQRIQQEITEDLTGFPFKSLKKAKVSYIYTQKYEPKHDAFNEAWTDASTRVNEDSHLNTSDDDLNAEAILEQLLNHTNWGSFEY